MIYELFVRKSFIRSSVYKIIIFAISFIHTEYEHVNKHRTECAPKQRQQQPSCKRRISLLSFFFFHWNLHIFSTRRFCLFFSADRKKIYYTLFGIRMNAIVMSSERAAYPPMDDELYFAVVRICFDWMVWHVLRPCKPKPI